MPEEKRKTNGKGKKGGKKYLHKSDTDTDDEESPPLPGNDPSFSQEKEQPGDFNSDDQSELGDHDVDPDDDSWNMEEQVDYEDLDKEDTPPPNTNPPTTPPVAQTYLSVQPNIKPLAPLQSLTQVSVTLLKNYWDTYKALPDGNQSLILYNQLIAVLGQVSSILYYGMSETAFAKAGVPHRPLNPYDEQDKELLNKLISSNEQVVLNLIHKEYVVDNETTDGVTTLRGIFPPFDPHHMDKVNEFFAMVNRLVHEHDVTPEQQRSILYSLKKDWYKSTVMSEQKKALMYNELFTPVPMTVFEFSSRYLTLMNRNHKEYLRNTRNAVDLCFKSFEKQADTRSTSSVSTKPQQNDPVLSQNTSKGGAPSNEEPPKKKGTTTAREPCILCGNDIKFMEKRNYVNRCNNNSKTCIFHDQPEIVSRSKIPGR